MNIDAINIAVGSLSVSVLALGVSATTAWLTLLHRRERARGSELVVP